MFSCMRTVLCLVIFVVVCQRDACYIMKYLRRFVTIIFSVVSYLRYI